MSSATLTVIESSPDMPLGAFEKVFADAGLTIRTVRPYAGDTVPPLTMTGSGLVVLGADATAYDDERVPWLPALRGLLTDAARSGVPTLAICLGAQLLAVAGGGQVEVAAPPGREAGAVRVFWRPEAREDPLVGAVARATAEAGARASVFGAVHADAVSELPDDAIWLASSNMYPFQAFRLGSAVGLQFHPEASTESLMAWYDSGVQADDVRRDAPAAGHEREAVLAGLVEAQDRAAAAGRTIAESFAACVVAASRETALA